MRLLFTVWGGMRGERSPYEDPFIAGAELACRQHAETIATYGHEIIFACLGPRDRDERIRGVRLVQRRHPLTDTEIDRDRFWLNEFEPLLEAQVDWTADLIERNRIEAIYTRVLWPTGALGYLLQEATGVPCVATVDDRVFVEQLLDGPHLLPEPARLEYAALMTRACEGVNRLVLPARHLETEIARFTRSPAPCHLVPSGLERARFARVTPRDWRGELGLASDDLLVICAARLDWPKRQDLLIQAVAKLAAQGTRLHLILIGTGGESQRLRHLAQMENITGRVHFVGYQPDTTIPAALLGGDIIAVPSDWEAFPIQLLEAMAADKPVLASDAPPFNDLLDAQDAIALCENTAESWTSGLGEILRRRTDPREAERRRAFVAPFLRVHSQEATSSRIEGVLLEAAGMALHVPAEVCASSLTAS